MVEGLTDPVCGLIMGKTAENLANEFNISRDEQDEFALESHQKAVAAAKKNIFMMKCVELEMIRKAK